MGSHDETIGFPPPANMDVFNMPPIFTSRSLRYSCHCEA